MNTLKNLQVALLILAGLAFLIGIITALGIIPQGTLILTIGGWQRIANTFVFFSIGIAMIILVKNKSS